MTLMTLPTVDRVTRGLSGKRRSASEEKLPVLERDEEI
jgi:hypothetical protein